MKSWLELLRVRMILIGLCSKLGLRKNKENGNCKEIADFGEELDFQEEVVARYREMDDIEEKIVFIDASKSKEIVFQQMDDALNRHMI